MHPLIFYVEKKNRYIQYIHIYTKIPVWIRNHIDQWSLYVLTNKSILNCIKKILINCADPPLYGTVSPGHDN